MKKTVSASLLVCLLLTSVGVAIAAPGSSFADIQRILDQGKLRVAILALDAPPMIMTDGNGKLTGSEVDLALDIGNKLGVDVEFVRTAETYDGVVRVVASAEADLGISFLSSGVQRARWVLFSQPYVTQNRRVFFNRAHFTRLRRELRVTSIAQLAETEAAATLEFGVLDDSINAWMLERYLPQFAMKRYGNLADMVTDVKEGRIFGGLHGELQIEYYMRGNPETAIHVALEPRARHPSDISIAVRPDAPNLLHWVNVYLANHVGLLDSEEIVERYIRIPMESR